MFMSDVSDRKVFAEILDCLPKPVVLLNRDGVIHDMNSFAKTLFGIKGYYNLPFHEWCHEHNLALSTLLTEKNEPNAAVKQCSVKHKNGSHILWKLTVLHTFEGYLVVGKDITKEVELANSLEQVGFLHEYILAKLPINVYWKDVNSIYLGCSDRLAKSIGLSSRNDIKGMSEFDFDWGVKDATKRHLAADSKVINHGKEITTEDSFKEIDGKVITLITKKTPLRNKKDEIIGVLGVSLDVTEERRLEDQLLKSKAREEHRLKALSSMGGMIAHELRTPLTGISFGMATLEKRMLQLVEIYEKWVVKLNESPIKQRNIDQLKDVCVDMQLSLKQIDNTIDTVLAGFRPSQVSEQSLQSIPVDKLFNDLLDQYPLSKDELKRISVEYNPKLVVRGIDHVLLHVLSNLIKNAFYFIQEMQKGEITLWASQDKEHVNIHVKDTAKGIDKDQIDKIFEPFFTTKDSAASIGMGLYFCRLAIEALNGEIHCESVKGEQTVFTLVLSVGDKNP